jgi:hypothetical protein
MSRTARQTGIPRVAERTKADARARLRLRERLAALTLSRGADPDALLWPVARECSDPWAWD